MHLLLTGLAGADDRRHPVDRDQLHRLALADSPRRGGTSRIRRLAALALTRLSLTSAAAVRALDACVADDLTSHLRAIDGR